MKRSLIISLAIGGPGVSPQSSMRTTPLIEPVTERMRSRMLSCIKRLLVKPCFSFFKKNDREREFVRTPVAAIRMLNGIVQSSTDILRWDLEALGLGILVK